MMYKVGRYVFPSKEYYEQLLNTRLVKEWDFSPEGRSKHDEEMKTKREGN